MTKKQLDGLKTIEPFMNWVKTITSLAVITAFLVGTGWALYAEPKIKAKLEPLEESVMYIKLILEEIVSDSILERVESKRRRLKL